MITQCRASLSAIARLTLLFMVMPILLPAQSTAPLQYPAARTVDQVDDYHGLRVADPYRWMEDLDSPEVKAWAAAENHVTTEYLSRLPNREAIKARLTALYNYPRVTVPYWEGGRWFYRRNSGLQRQAVWYTRETLDGPERVLIDPNVLSPDGSVALSQFSPSPDGKHYVYGLSEGGSDWETFYVRDFTSDRNTADTVRWVKFSGASWTKDGKGFFYSRFPEPPKGKEIQTALVNGTMYYHRLGTPQAADVKIYARPDHPTWIVGGGVDETGRYLFVRTAKGTDKNELYVADLGDPLKPHVQAQIVPVVTGHDANYSPLGVVNGQLYLQTDRGAPNRKIVAAPIATPDPAHWHDVLPEGKTAIQTSGLVAGRLAVGDARGRRRGGASVLVGGRRRPRHPAARTRHREWRIRALRPSGGVLRLPVDAGAARGDPLRPRIGHQPAVRAAAFDVRPVAVRDGARVLPFEGRHARPDVHRAPEGHALVTARTRR